MDGSNTPLQVSKSWSSYIIILEFDFIEIEGTIEVIGKYAPKKKKHPPTQGTKITRKNENNFENVR